MKCKKCLEQRCEDCGLPINNSCGCPCHTQTYYPWSGTVPCCPCRKMNFPTSGTTGGASNYPGFNVTN